MSDEGGDESPPRPKRKIKRVMIVSSSSGSDSDESIALARIRRKKLRVVSDDGSSDSSSGSVVVAARRRRAIPKLRDSEAESDSSGCGETSQAVPSTSRQSGFASDSSEGNSEKCSICLYRFTNQEIGTPSNCEHIFCLDCITEWSKTVNTCPVDRISFNGIVVRACIGGRVLRTEPVKVVERRPSIEIILATNCEICGGAENEESMLLCDGCDLGYHMQCLTPPLTEVPTDQWLCPNCDIFDVMDYIDMAEVEDLFMENSGFSMPLGPRPSPLRAPRNVRRSNRTQRTDSGREPNRTNNTLGTEPGTSRSRSTRARRPQKRKRTRRSRVIIEYEIEENGKFPITKSITRRVRKRKSRRQPRTVARRSHVRASVRARLASLRSGTVSGTSGISGNSGIDLPVARERAAIPSLSLYGNYNDLEFFSDDEMDVSEGASTAVAVRPTSSIVNAYRQTRRKMISIPSPPHAASAPDLLSNILESQTLLHSKNSIVSVTVDGNVNIKLQKSKSIIPKNHEDKKQDKVDVSKSEDCTKKVPSYPGQSRGGGWGGGYRGSYHRPPEHGANNFNRGGYDNYGGAYPNRPPSNMFNNNYQNNRRDSEPEYFDNFPRRPHQFPPNDDPYFDRQRRNSQNDTNRPQNFSNTRHNEQNQGRYSLGPSWQPHGNASGPHRQDLPPTPSSAARHSFGGFENPLDMRMGQMPPRTSNIDYSRPEQDKPQQLYTPPEPQTFQPMPQPPMFNFPKTGELEKSEDEKSDSGLVIDTEKYDPTEPTNDDDSDDQKHEAKVSESELAESPAPAPLPPSEPPTSVQSILAGLDTSSMNVPPNVLDTAVRQVLQEHRNLIISPDKRHDKSDEDSDGDCPNFSIYSATSVHIANNTSSVVDEIEQIKPPHDSMEDLVQEDDIPTPEAASPLKSDNDIQNEEAKVDIPVSKPSYVENIVKNKTLEEYNEKVSKRCPITTNTRNPIKIKLNTPSLIKRVTLYDEEDMSQDVTEKADVEPEDKTEINKPSPKINEQSDKILDTKSPDDAEICTNKSDKPEESNECKNDVSNEKEPLEEKITSETEKVETECDSRNDDYFDEDKSPEYANTEVSDSEICLTGKDDETNNKDDEDNVEKMTESISETEDERSYTPCLDENKPKDNSFESEKDRALDGLETEMISEEEGNEMFSESERPPSERSEPSAPPARPDEPPERLEKKKTDKKKSDTREEGKKKKKKDSKKEGKEKSKSKKKSEVAFKKLSKSGKERNYRERDKDDKKKKDRRSSSEPPETKKRRKEKRKDLERYDVRTVVSEKRRKVKDPFGRDISPPSPSPPPRRSPSAPRARRTPSRPRRSPSRSRRSISRARRSISRARRSISRARRSMSPLRHRRTTSRPRRSPPRAPARPPRRSPSPRSPSPRRSPPRKRRRRSGSRPRRRRSGSAASRRANKKKKRTRSERSPSPRRPPPSPSIDSQLLSPRTPPPDPLLDPPPADPPPRRRRDPERRARRARDPPGPSKEVFTSGDNILVSVSFKEQERADDGERRRRRDSKRERRRRSAAAPRPPDAAKPVAIIDLDRSPFRELTPSPRDVIVLSDSDPERPEQPAPAEPAPAPPAAAPGPKTPPEPSGPEPPPSADPAPAAERSPAAAHESPQSADAYDPFEPTGSPGSGGAEAGGEAERPSMTLEAAQRTNMSADEVLDRRPLSPAEKVMALLQSTRDASPEPPPGGAPEPASAPAPRIVLPSPTRAPSKLFPGKSPIKSNPVKPMQAVRPEEGSAYSPNSPYSPGSSSFDLFEPRASLDAILRARRPNNNKLTPTKHNNNKKKGKTQVGVKIDEDKLKILDELPSSAVEMQVKSKFLKKLNRQERVVEEVKLVLKPHYNKKHVTKEQYKDILRKAVPKICHNKTGEINPAKIQSLVEAYVKKYRKRSKLGLA